MNLFTAVCICSDLTISPFTVGQCEDTSTISITYPAEALIGS